LLVALAFFSQLTLHPLAFATDPATVVVRVNPAQLLGVNNMSLGFQLDYEWKDFVRDEAAKELMRKAEFKLVRVQDFTNLRPCEYWNETTDTGRFNWTNVDQLIQDILAIGAQPMIVLGGGHPNVWAPPGMTINPATGLPDPHSYAAYATEWVKHFKITDLPVRFYELWNEPWTYFGWAPVDFSRLSNFMNLFNTAASRMRQESPNLSISFDFIMHKPVLEYWLAHGGADVDSLDFHKYDDHKYDDFVTENTSNAEMLSRAETQYFGEWPLGYSLQEARQHWFKARGKWLPIIDSESNFNAAWQNGTDPRIQQMMGAVWLGLVLRMSVLEDVTYHVYYLMASSRSYAENKLSGGYGFGMINSDNNRPWYPYYLLQMIGRNLSVGDHLINMTTSSDDIRPLSWIHNGTVMVLLICRVDQTRSLFLQGVSGYSNFLKIDNTISWKSPAIQSGEHDLAEPLMVEGYTVLLMQAKAFANHPGIAGLPAESILIGVILGMVLLRRRRELAN
jgi:hypothetical protein